MNTERYYERQNPLTQYHTGKYPLQDQPYPGVQADMDPKPDCGEKTYAGKGRLVGRKALVTGGDSGIGRAAAIAFAREGADVAIAYMPAEEHDAQEVRGLIEAEGRKAVLLPGDLSDEGYCSRLAAKARDGLGGLDILALVAGHQVASPSIEEITTQQLEKVFAVNVFSIFWVLRPALSFLPAGTSIILTSSIEAVNPNATLPDYAATKGAIKALSGSLAKQLAPKGIRVNAVAPGPVWTALQISGGQLDEKIPQFGLDTPFKRAGQPVELAPLYVLLASQEASFVSGCFYGAAGGKTL